MKRCLYGFAVCCFLLSGALHCLADPVGEITREDAMSLVRAWLTSEGYPTRSQHFILEADPDRADFPAFYFFTASFEQEQSVPTIGHFAVNRRTANLWDWELCKKLSKSSLRAKQAVLRKKARVSERDYQKSSQAAPCSEPT